MYTRYTHRQGIIIFGFEFVTQFAAITIEMEIKLVQKTINWKNISFLFPINETLLI